jgi:hypothetical protein
MVLIPSALSNAISVANPVASIAGQATGVIKDEKAPFGASSSNSIMSMISNYLGTIICFIALYFAFKCKSETGGVDIIHVLAACLCSPCYLIYHFAVGPCGKK